jgi:succinyl-diaminopimelate desuccinylase
LKARFNLRWSPQQTLEGLKSTVDGILARHRVKYSLDWFVSGLPFYTAAGPLTEAVTAAVVEVTGLRPKLTTGGGTSDGRFIAPTGAQVVELGVVNATIHKVNEHCRVSDIETARQMYGRVLELLLNC